MLDEQRPFFAPVAAIITLGLAAGRRGRRALEVGIGVTLGIAVADAFVMVAGSGTWQLVVIVLLAMSVAVFLGGSPGVVGQAAVSASFVVVLEPPEGVDFARTLHAAIGVGSAFLLSFVLLPVNPLRVVRRAARPVLGELAGALHDMAAALEARDREAVQRATARARAIDPLARRFADALEVGRETAVAALPRRRTLSTVEAWAEAGAHIDLAVRNVRVLGRGAMRAVELDHRMPPETWASLHELADAIAALERWLEDPSALDDSRRHAAASAGLANAVLEMTTNLSVSSIVETVRSTAVDVLRSTGMSRDEAVALVRSQGPPELRR